MDPGNSSRFEEYAKIYYEARQHKGIRMEDARDRMQDPTYFGTMMVHTGGRPRHGLRFHNHHGPDHPSRV